VAQLLHLSRRSGHGLDLVMGNTIGLGQARPDRVLACKYLDSEYICHGFKTTYARIFFLLRALWVGF
jgi:hypothetical protein